MVEVYVAKRGPFKVAEVMNEDFEVVLNAGSIDNVFLGQRFMVYRIGSEVKDPDTGESLGLLEIVVGPGIVTGLQERMCILRSSKKAAGPTRIIKRRSYFSLSPEETEEVGPDLAPFASPVVGDLAKRL